MNVPALVVLALALAVCWWMLRAWFGPCPYCGSKARPCGDVATETARCPDCDGER